MLDFWEKDDIIIFVGCERATRQNKIAGLCKGSTTDSDSVCEGSNPSPAARKKLKPDGFSFFYLACVDLNPHSAIPERFSPKGRSEWAHPGSRYAALARRYRSNPSPAAKSRRPRSSAFFVCLRGFELEWERERYSLFPQAEGARQSVLTFRTCCATLFPTSAAGWRKTRLFLCR